MSTFDMRTGEPVDETKDVVKAEEPKRERKSVASERRWRQLQLQLVQNQTSR